MSSPSHVIPHPMLSPILCYPPSPVLKLTPLTENVDSGKNTSSLHSEEIKLNDNNYLCFIKTVAFLPYCY